ncbi:MAG TPA: MerR family transcriptional regulator [Marmoricola sp.]|nr:MerR family transcriptional regulator [Marmoricola sp.]
MFTIQQAARSVGVTQATLRTWERRYGIVSPQRTGSGYRSYDRASLARLTAMRQLVDEGWSPQYAAAAILDGQVPVDDGPATTPHDAPADDRVAAAHTEQFLAAAARMDGHGIERSLDVGMSLGSFEHAVDSWLMPTLVALGEGWARGDVDVAGEHMASHHVLRRLSAAFEAAGSRSRGPKVVVGLPAGSRHELGALAFATALRRLGLDVLYLGAAVPEASWPAAVRAHRADAAVVGVVTESDRTAAHVATRSLMASQPGLLIARGGACRTSPGDGVHELPERIADAARELDELLHAARKTAVDDGF